MMIGAIAGLAASAAQAQQRSSATYDDWTITCVENQKTCELSSQQTSDQSAVASQITISGNGKDGPLKLSIQIPPNIWLANGPKLSGGKENVILTATYRWCVPSRCLADADLNQDALRKLSDSGDQPGKLAFRDAAQHDQTIPVSFKGLSQALQASNLLKK
jgi:invasion protein IalB